MVGSVWLAGASRSGVDDRAWNETRTMAWRPRGSRPWSCYTSKCCTFRIRSIDPRRGAIEKQTSRNTHRGYRSRVSSCELLLHSKRAFVVVIVHAARVCVDRLVTSDAQRKGTESCSTPGCLGSRDHLPGALVTTDQAPIEEHHTSVELRDLYMDLHRVFIFSVLLAMRAMLCWSGTV